MNVLIACEFSGVVRRAFKALGHNTWSCDTLPSDDDSTAHLQMDIFDCLDKYGPWDLMIAHPPCTHLAVSGARWFKDKVEEQKQAIEFFMRLVSADIPRIAVENPISIMSTKYRKPDQIIQPWQFGHGETKSTCLWLKGLPKLTPTNIVSGREQRVHKLPPSADRWKLRSITYQGIADAMANQWGIIE
jgi:site-specific DNA-cytosine methylase